MPVNLSSTSTTLRLEIKGIVPSFKNNKMLVTRSPQGKPLRRALLITKPEYQKAMEAITKSLELQLLSAFQTACGGTLTGPLKRLLTVLSVPADDCWTIMPDTTIKAELCEPGQEGATIEITRIT